MAIVYKLATLGIILAGLFGILFVYTGLSMAFKREHRFTRQIENESLASIVFSIAAGFALLGLATWLIVDPPAWWPAPP